jgi:hypothetical protein
MKVCGFTFVRNGVKFDYPIVEAIQSILPICDSFLVAIGNGEDDTEALIKGIQSAKIKIIHTVWDDTLREGGRVLAVETDKAFQAIGSEFDWAFYLQADEVVHETSLPIIKQAMQDNLDNPTVEGLLFKYFHFYGSYEYVGEAYSWCRREIRVIRNRKDIFSYRDAQGFRKKPNDKLRVKLIDAYVYHYSWVRDPRALQSKIAVFHTFWHDDTWIEKTVVKAEKFDYGNAEVLGLFKGTHPSVMKERIARQQWRYSHDISRNPKTIKFLFKRFVEKLTGWRVGEYRNYKLIR